GLPARVRMVDGQDLRATCSEIFDRGEEVVGVGPVARLARQLIAQRVERIGPGSDPPQDAAAFPRGLAQAMLDHRPEDIGGDGQDVVGLGHAVAQSVGSGSRSMMACLMADDSWPMTGDRESPPIT